MHCESLNERRQRRRANASIRIEHNLRLAHMLRTEVPRCDLLHFVLQPLVGRTLTDDTGQFLSLAVKPLSFAFCQVTTISEKRRN